MQTNSSAIVWSQPGCPGCETAKSLLTTNNIPFIVKTVGVDATLQELQAAVPNARSVPHIFIDNVYIGGLNKLRTYFQ